MPSQHSKSEKPAASVAPGAPQGVKRRRKILPYFVVLTAAIALWVSGILLSETLVKRGQKEMLAKELARAEKERSTAAGGSGMDRQNTAGHEAPQFVALEQLDLPPEVAEIRKRAGANPQDEAANLLLAQNLVVIGNSKRDPVYLMHGLGAYQATLRINPKNLTALRGLGDLCAEQGIFDEAAKNYSTYLEIKPDDIKARTDYALVLIQSGNAENGIANLDRIISANNDNFPARLARALGFRVLGDFKRAAEETKNAMNFAPDDTARSVAVSFLHQIEAAEKNPPKDETTPSGKSKPVIVADDQAAGPTSPGAAVDSYFRSHPIIGPKLDAVIWDGPNRVRIQLKDFPVDAMPQMAREKFLSRAKETLSALPQQIDIDLADADSGKILLQLSVGGASAAPKEQP